MSLMYPFVSVAINKSIMRRTKTKLLDHIKFIFKAHIDRMYTFAKYLQLVFFVRNNLILNHSWNNLYSTQEVDLI